MWAINAQLIWEATCLPLWEGTVNLAEGKDIFQETWKPSAFILQATLSSL